VKEACEVGQGTRDGQIVAVGLRAAGHMLDPCFDHLDVGEPAETNHLAEKCRFLSP
jgi:hypothetical protein